MVPAGSAPYAYKGLDGLPWWALVLMIVAGPGLAFAARARQRRRRR
ncbi:hypothetical protein [Streptomyces sp. NPDC015131]